MDKYSQVIASRIVAMCKERGISIHQLSRMSGVRHSTLDNIVNHNTLNPGIKTIHKLATAFCMTPAEFLDFKELNDYSFADEETEIDEP